MSVQAQAPGATEPSSAPKSLADQLAQFTASVRVEDVPPAIRRQAAWLVLDWLGCAIAGLATPPGRMFVQHTHDQPRGIASCVGLADGRGPQVAALHNGGLSHIVEMDDVDRASVMHPGAVVVPAALAVAERVGAPGRDFLTAVVLGYEVAIRIGESVGRTHYFHWHNTSTCGVFGAATASGWLLGLDAERMAWALGNAGTQAGGLWEFIAEGAMSKHLHAGRAAANGVLAAELAALGFTGARRILEGRQGFFAATAQDGNPSAVVARLGSGWKLPGVSIKPYPSCRHTHSSIDAVLELRTEHALAADEIEWVEIATYHSVLDLTDNPRPAHTYAAKFSVQYCVARALLAGAVQLADFSDARIAESAARELMGRVRVVLDPTLDARYPREFPARVSVGLRDGRTLSLLVASPKGDPETPLSEDELAAKFSALVAFSPYANRTRVLLETIVDLDSHSNLRGLLALEEIR